MIRLRSSFWVVLALFVVSLGWAFVSGNALYYRLSFIWGGVLLVGYFWVLFSLQGIRLTRSMRTSRHQVGQLLSEERFELTNASWFPKLWISIEDQSKIPGGSGSRVLTLIGGLQKRTYVAYNFLNRRGYFACGPTLLRSGDLFGLFEATRTIQATSTILVLPYVVDLVEFPIPSGLLQGGKALRRRTLEITPHAAGVREYYPGDPLSRIHWSTTARRQHLMVKEFDQDPQADVWILLDMQESKHSRLEDQTNVATVRSIFSLRNLPKFELPSDSVEYSISAGASVAQYYVRENMAVGLASAGRMFTVIPPERGERQLGKIFETLALINGDGNQSIIALWSALRGHIARGSIMVLITPQVDSFLVGLVDELLIYHMHPIVVAIDTATFGGYSIPERTIREIGLRGIPYYIIRNRDNLQENLRAEALWLAEKEKWWLTQEEPLGAENSKFD